MHVFIRKISKAWDPKLQCFMKEHWMSIFQFDTHLLMDPMYKRSHKVFPRHFAHSLCCQRYRSFSVGCASAQASGSHILNPVRLCSSRCVLWDAWKYACLFRFPEVKCQSVGFSKGFCPGFSLIDLNPCAGPCVMPVTQKCCIVPLHEKAQVEQIWGGSLLELSEPITLAICIEIRRGSQFIIVSGFSLPPSCQHYRVTPRLSYLP